MAQKVLTAPLAVIKVGGIPVGKMKSIRVTETIRRGRVSGIGQLTPDELPALEWTGSLNCSFYNIDFSTSQIPKSILRKMSTLQEWIDTVLLQEDGVQIDIFKKVKDTVGPTGIIKGKLEVYATIKGVFMDREAFDISEGQISGRDQDFTYLYPILFTP